MYWISNLASKNIKENCPILIFDDPVNAIDDEHRAAIRETLFKDSFSNKLKSFSLSMVKSSSIILIKC